MGQDLIVSEGWANRLAEDCLNIKLVLRERMQEDLKATYWQIGERILTDESYQRYARGNRKFLQGLARYLGMCERNIYLCLEAYQEFPVFEKITEPTWNRMVKKLPTHRKQKDPKPTYQDLMGIIERTGKLLNREYQFFPEIKRFDLKLLQEFMRYLEDQFDKIKGGML